MNVWYNGSMKEIFMALLVFAVVGGIFAFGIRYHEQTKKATDTRPSIAEFSSADIPKEDSTMATSDVSDSALSDNTTKDVAIARPESPENITVKVLNGGAAGGSAGKIATYLKTNGYTKAEAGNANGSNTGIVIYYSSEMEDESKALQLLLLKEYKGVVSKPAEDAKIPEAKTAPMVVVLGA